MTRKWIGILAILMLFVSSEYRALAISQDMETEEAPTAEQSPQPKKKTKGRRAGEKETEGTQALNRFEADPVIKSQYQLNGEQLEVDPD